MAEEIKERERKGCYDHLKKVLTYDKKRKNLEKEIEAISQTYVLDDKEFLNVSNLLARAALDFVSCNIESNCFATLGQRLVPLDTSKNT